MKEQRSQKLIMKKKIGLIIIAGTITAGTLTACGTTNPTTISQSTSQGENGKIDIGMNTGFSQGESWSMSIPGTYKGIECGFVGDAEKKTDEDFSLILNDDGTGINKRDGQEFELTWKMEGNKFLMTDKYMGIAIDYTGEFNNGKLTIFNGDPEDELTYQYIYEKE